MARASEYPKVGCQIMKLCYLGNSSITLRSFQTGTIASEHWGRLYASHAFFQVLECHGPAMGSIILSILTIEFLYQTL